MRRRSTPRRAPCRTRPRLPLPAPGSAGERVARTLAKLLVVGLGILCLWLAFRVGEQGRFTPSSLPSELVRQGRLEEALDEYARITSAVPGTVQARLAAEAIPEVAFRLAKEKMGIPEEPEETGASAVATTAALLEPARVQAGFAYEEAAALLQSVVAPSVSDRWRMPARDLLIDLSTRLGEALVPVPMLQTYLVEMADQTLTQIEHPDVPTPLAPILVTRLVRDALFYPRARACVLSSTGQRADLLLNVASAIGLLERTLPRSRAPHGRRELARRLADLYRLAGEPDRLKAAVADTEPGAGLLPPESDWGLMPLGTDPIRAEPAYKAWYDRQMEQLLRQERNPVAGRLLTDGKPLTSGLLLFEPALDAAGKPRVAVLPRIAETAEHGFFEPGGAVRSAFPDADGLVQVPHLEPGLYRIHLLLLGRGADPRWPMSLRFGTSPSWVPLGPDTPEHGLRVEPGTTAFLPPIELARMPEIRLLAPAEDSVVAGVAPTLAWQVDLPPGSRWSRSALSYRMRLEPVSAQIAAPLADDTISVLSERTEIHYPPIQTGSDSADYPPLAVGARYRAEVDLFVAGERVPARCIPTSFTVMTADYPAVEPVVNRVARRVAEATQAELYVQPSLAIERIERCLTQYPTTIHRDWLLVNAGRAREALGDRAGAAAAYREATSFNPTSLHAREAQEALAALTPDAGQATLSTPDPGTGAPAASSASGIPAATTSPPPPASGTAEE